MMPLQTDDPFVVGGEATGVPSGDAPAESEPGDAVLDLLEKKLEAASEPRPLPPMPQLTMSQRFGAAILASLDPDGYQKLVLPMLRDMREQGEAVIQQSEREKSREQSAFNAMLMVAQRRDDLAQRKEAQAQRHAEEGERQALRAESAAEKSRIQKEKDEQAQRVEDSFRAEAITLEQRHGAIVRRAAAFLKLTAQFADQPALGGLGPDAMATVAAMAEPVATMAAISRAGGKIEPGTLARFNADLDSLDNRITQGHALLTQFTESKPKAGSGKPKILTRLNPKFVGEFTSAIGDVTDALYLLKDFEAVGRPGGWLASKIATSPSLVANIPEMLGGFSDKQLEVIQRYATLVQKSRKEFMGVAQSVIEIYKSALNIPDVGANGDVVANDLRQWVYDAYSAGLEKKQAMDIVDYDTSEMGLQLAQMFAKMTPDLQYKLINERGLPDVPIGTVVLGHAIDASGTAIGWKIRLPDGELATKRFYTPPPATIGAPR